MTEDEVLAFIKKSIKSVWALELLLLVRREPDRHWSADALVRELRSSETAVSDAVASLADGGYVSVGSDGLLQYRPISPDLDGIVGQVDSMYATRPIAVVKAITSAPNERLRIFSDAFKLKNR